MPYIEEERREFFPRYNLVCCPGDLNYAITQQIKSFLGTKPNYDKFNAAVGVLESAKLELYRRMIAPYEDKKKEENGDVY